MNSANICQQTTKWRHILEITSYCYCDVSFIQSTFHSSDIRSIVHFQLEDFEFITRL